MSTFLTHMHTKPDLDTCIQSTKPPSTRQVLTQTPRIRVVADTNPKDYGSMSHLIRASSFASLQTTFPTTSDEPPSTHGRNAPSPEVTTAGPVDETLPVHRSKTTTPEASKPTTAGLDEITIPLDYTRQIPFHAGTYAYIHPDTSSPSFPPQQLPRASSYDTEDDEWLTSRFHRRLTLGADHFEVA
ncbi:hypothetical protein BKA82DRAFT_29252 [Pisolithus tinctorius]|uniref:Uncharacterized protein n=1 Tax=Pisolithus tinctorius Marx 270 TaxID=870435 RepID=A0A0C3JTT3_PISTI|nr:hypothetical protein BKA82DRAFT_29252 [Pisolithus tinctorius]KIO00857.1 hypothetical protein M404DRAFT_29252 [Pisolithus tinctorius Marx 270]